MPSTKELDLIIRLRKANTGELQKLDKEIESFHKNVKKGASNISSGYNVAGKAVSSFKSKIDEVSKAIGGVGTKAADSQIKLSGMTRKTAEAYADLIKNTKHAEEICNQLARSLLNTTEATKKAGLSVEEYNSRLRQLTTTEYYQILARENKALASSLVDSTNAAKENARGLAILFSTTERVSSSLLPIVTQTTLLEEAERRLVTQIRFSSEMQTAYKAALTPVLFLKEKFVVVSNEMLAAEERAAKGIQSSNEKAKKSSADYAAALAKSEAALNSLIIAYDNLLGKLSQVDTSSGIMFAKNQSVIKSLKEANMVINLAVKSFDILRQKEIEEGEASAQAIAAIDRRTEALKRLAASLKSTNVFAQWHVDTLYSCVMAYEKTIPVVNSLGEALRKIQVISQLRGESFFAVGIKSTQAFISELEKLRMEFAKVSGEKIYAKTGVTAGMIEQFNELFFKLEEFKIKLATLENALASSRKYFREWAENGKQTTGEIAEAFLKSKTVLTGVLDSMGVNLKKVGGDFEKLERVATKQLSKMKDDFYKQEGVIEKFSTVYKTVIDEMRANLLLYSETSLSVWAKEKKELKIREGVLLEASNKLNLLNESYNKLKIMIDECKKTSISFLAVQKQMNATLEAANVVMSELGASSQARAAQIQESISIVSAQMITYERLSGSIIETVGAVQSLEKQQARLKDVQNLVGKNTVTLTERIGLYNKEVNLLINSLMTLVFHMKVLKNNGTATGAEFADLELRIKQLVEMMQKAEGESARLSGELQQLQQKTGDASRAMGRMGSEGFANMIISQAAWMAGFQVIFGTLDKFKQALEAIKETQLAVSRAMRTVRSETDSQAEIYKILTDAVNEMRSSMGTAASETGEALYQLGSAGLKLNEVLAALKPTMDNIVGSEADMEQITNLVAGLYNNFGNQILKVDGKVQTISNTFDGYNDKVTEAASVTEKFKHINDLLIRTFDAHQAEMDQIRDGLKFMTQSAKAANLSLTQQLGILATLHDHLIKAGAAGRGMRVILSRISKEGKDFKEAFDLDIDLSKPMDFIEIVSQLSKKLKDQVLTIDELGLVFKRMGLRGTEPLLVLIQNFDELNKNIEDLTENSENAAENMRKIRLDNLGDQAKIASGKIEVLLKKGLEPLAAFLKIVAVTFNIVAEVIGKVNDLSGGLLGTAVKFAGLVALFKALAFAGRNVGLAWTWLSEVFHHLNDKMENFRQNSEKTTTTIAKKENVIRRTGNAFREYGKNVMAVNGTIAQANGAMASQAVVLTGLSRAVEMAKNAWLALSTVLKAIVLFLVIDLVIRLVTWISNLGEEFIKTTEKIKKEEVAISNNITRMENLKYQLNETKFSNDNFKSSLEKVADQLGLNINDYSNSGNAVRALNEELKNLIETQKIVQQSLRYEYLKNSLKIMGDTLSDANFEIGKLIFSNNLWRNSIDKVNEKTLTFNNILTKLKENQKILNAELKKGVPPEFAESVKKMSDETNNSIKFFENAIIVFGRIKTALVDVKNKFVEVTTSVGKLNKEMTLEEKIATSNEISIKKLAETFGESLSPLSEFLNTISKIWKVLPNIGRDLIIASVSVGALEESLEKVSRDQSLEKFRMDIAEVIAKLKEFGTKTPEKLNKVLEAASKLGEQGVVQILKFYNSVDSLKKKVAELDNSIDKISLEILRREFDLAAEKADLLRKRLEQLQSMTKEYGDKVSETKTALREGQAAEQEYTHQLSSSSDKLGSYMEKEARRAAQQKINTILTERHKRAEDEFTKAVGKGSRSLDDIKANTEKYKRALENSKIELIKAQQELDSAWGGTKRYTEATKQLEKAKRDVANAEKILREEEARGKEDLERLTIETNKQIASQNEKIKKSQEMQEASSKMIEKVRDEIIQTDNSNKGLSEKAQKYEELKTKIQEQIKMLNEEYKAREEIIKLREQKGEITKEEARTQLDKLQQELLAKRVELEKQMTEASREQIQNIEALKLKYIEAINALTLAIEKMTEGLKTLQAAMLEKKFEMDFDGAIEDFERFKKKIEDFFLTGPGSKNNPYKVYYKYIAVNKPPGKEEGEGGGEEGQYWGGVIKRTLGGIVPARVTKGEGYFSPSFTSKNLGLLNSLNSGKIVSRVPSSIPTFKGPGGVDNIHTYLPRGSYVLSKRGMEAYEASVKKGAQTFQEGGEVSEPIATSSASDHERVGSFTIVVEKEGRSREFPIMGKVSVLKSLKSELEEDRLTRLH